MATGMTAAITGREEHGDREDADRDECRHGGGDDWGDDCRDGCRMAAAMNAAMTHVMAPRCVLLWPKIPNATRNVH